MRTLGEGEHELACTRFNRYFPLLRLGRLGEAQQVLEDCLAVFRRVDDLTNQKKALSALADLWNRRGDITQAVALERQALAVCDRLPDLADRSISHGNLSNYLDDAGETEESARHLLARFCYDLLTGHKQLLSTAVARLIDRLRRSGGDYELPRVAALLERPDFAALRQALAGFGADSEALQAAVDGLVAEARRRAETEE